MHQQLNPNVEPQKQIKTDGEGAALIHEAVGEYERVTMQIQRQINTTESGSRQRLEGPTTFSSALSVDFISCINHIGFSEGGITFIFIE